MRQIRDRKSTLAARHRQIRGRQRDKQIRGRKSTLAATTQTDKWSAVRQTDKGSEMYTCSEIQTDKGSAVRQTDKGSEVYTCSEAQTDKGPIFDRVNKIASDDSLIPKFGSIQVCDLQKRRSDFVRRVYTLSRSSADYHKYLFRTPVVQGHDSVVGPNLRLTKTSNSIERRTRVLNSK